MRQGPEVKINFNKKRSFCYYNLNGRRFKVYNWKSSTTSIEPNKEPNLVKRKEDLIKLKKAIEKDFRKTPFNIEKNLYDQSLFNERIPISIFEHPIEGSIYAAKIIADTIINKQYLGENCILGLATGSSPITIYSELVRLHQEENLSFKNVITFNLDEYWPMNKNSKYSYHKFMFDNLFNHIDIDPKNINIPNGDVSSKNIEKHCIKFENQIKKLGGLDLQLLGIGRNGHIGFNEPGTLKSSITRKVRIEYTTRFDASEEFGGIDNVPNEAISMGTKTILDAKRIILVAWGSSKSKIIKKAIEEKENDIIPASLLQSHNNTLFILDKDSASNLERFMCPWLYTDINKPPFKPLSTTIIGWNKENIKKAVIWLSLKKKKPILLLTDEDYNENGMGGIFEHYKSSYETNIEVFNLLQHTITGWPGGKPNADDSSRPERSSPPKKRVIIFSPHPDDDVISMGGTFDRLIQQGHDVHVAYQTSGNTAVWDEYLIEIFEQNDEIYKAISKDSSFLKLSNKYIKQIKEYTEQKIDKKGFATLNEIKGAIRRSEAYQACKLLGLKDKEKIHFLDMPFYQKGGKKRKDISKKDVDKVKNLIQKIKPHQIFAAGDLNDPHGTHRLCLRSIYQSIRSLKNLKFIKNCSIWLYKGAWNEWKVNDIEMAVPLSPDQIIKKRKAIFKHKSQKDGAVFPGNDPREFWQRAEERSAKTANKYSELGLAKYAAIEGFKRYRLDV